VGIGLFVPHGGENGRDESRRGAGLLAGEARTTRASIRRAATERFRFCTRGGEIRLRDRLRPREVRARQLVPRGGIRGSYRMTRKQTEGDSGIATESREKVHTKKPKQFRVILLNDDYTTTDFVVAVLESVFQKSPAEAISIMLQVHRGG